MNVHTTTPGQVKGQTLTVLCPTPFTGVVVCHSNRMASLRTADGRLLSLGYAGSPLVVVGVK